MDSALLKLLVLLTWVASCMGRRCWWQAEYFCQNRTCDDAHYMWRGFDDKSKLSVQLFCPKSEGHDVVLCEHPNWTGECYVTQIPKEQNCSNVDPEINDLATSVHTLGGCIRLYDEANCQGKSMVFDKGTVGHNRLTEMNDLVSSVGLCSEEDRPKGGCNQATPEGRLECQSNRCYWLGEPHCGEATCGNDHFIKSGFNQSTCHNKSTNFCCPKKGGTDVVLCEHYDLEGECIVTHIPEGETCVEVEINDWASSVHVLGGCVKLYQDTGCKNLLMVYNEHTFDHNLPPEMNDIVTSVGICSFDYDSEDECNWVVMEGGSKCLATTMGPTELPTLAEDWTTLSLQETTIIENCILSKTVVNDKSVCENSVIFYDDFQKFDSNKWNHEIKANSRPDYEFTVYNKKPENIFVEDGSLHMKPTVNNENFVENGELNLDRCTGDVFDDECSRKTDTFILPPVQSARITTRQKLNFKYGLIEVQAQFPVGDWIAADIRLVPMDCTYGPQYESGLVRIISRGNLNLKKPDGEEMGRQTVEGSVMLGHGRNVKGKSVFYRRDKGWQKEFHNFTILWTPEDISFSVDGKQKRDTMKDANGSRLCDVVGLPSSENKIWSTGTPIAPFNQPFYLSLGLSVGGIRDFEDGWENNGESKPWSNTDPKAMLSFWKRKNEWERTWTEDSTFQIKSVKITAL